MNHHSSDHIPFPRPPCALALLALAALSPQLAAGALDPATYYEYVGIGGSSASGTNLSLAEFVTVTLLSSEWAYRGGGTGLAQAGDIVPLTAEGVLHLTGDTNISGIGGTATVETRYQFQILTNGPGLPAVVPLLLHASASVWVDSNLPVGESFARITSPFGQFQADNYDAHGAYTGSFAGHWDVPIANWQVSNIGTVTLYVNTHGQGCCSGYGPGYFFDSRVFIDSEVEIDPAFALASMYSVELSPGVLLAPGAPTLAITLTSTNTVVVSWPLPASGWLLHVTTNLVTNGSTWTEIPPPYETNGVNLQFTEPLPAGSKFYRLHKP